MRRGGWTGGPVSRKTHGHAQTGAVSSEYNIWKGMRSRCHDPKHEHYASYGGRGITVCARWRDDFAAFLQDLGPRPPGRTLNRIDNDGDYEPGNVEWATRKTQANNRRSNRLLELNGQSQTLTAWAAELGIIPETIGQRLKAGWSVVDALTKPVRLGSTVFGPPKRGNISGVCGVSWDKDRRKWRASIRLAGKTKYLGLFSSVDEATAARKNAEEQIRRGSTPSR